jgi:hypothetical protein
VDRGAPKDSGSHTAPGVAGDPDDEERTDA